MIEIKNLTLAYGKKIVLDQFSAHFSLNTISAITGRNGSGKSSLLDAISGDLPAKSGSIEINGHSIPDLTLEEMAYLRSYGAQNHTYWAPYRAEEILQLGHDLVSEERVNHLVVSLDLTSFLHQPVTTLSGGQLQRIEIARSLMRQSPLVLLDEPFASQDKESVERITALIQGERSHGTTFIIVMHERESRLTWCDQVINLDS